jgi:hypothetical protein
MASLPTSKKPPVVIGMEKPLQARKFKSAKLVEKPLQARKFKSAKLETCYIVFTFVA